MIWADRLAVVLLFIACIWFVWIEVTATVPGAWTLGEWKALGVFCIPAIAVLVIGRVFDWVFTGKVRGWLGQP